MGWAKYHEDDEEKVIERTEYYRKHVYRIDPVKYFVCPYCGLVENNQSKLFEHIKKSHNITHPVVFINGKVVNDGEYNIATIDSLNIFTYGFSDEIFLNNENYSSEEAYSIDLTNEAKKLISLNDSFVMRVGNNKISVNKYSVKKVRNEITEPVIRKWEKSVAEGKTISMDLPSDINNIEREYLRGFYSYFLACISEGEDKKNRYNDANAIIRGFNPINALGMCVLKVIAFRLNWINSLRELCKFSNDEFNAAVYFYDNEEYKAIDINNEEHHEFLYVEDDIRESIDAINSYLSGNMAEVDAYLGKYNIENVKDKNLKDRLLVLSAKREYDKGKLRKARFYNDKILSQQLKINY